MSSLIDPKFEEKIVALQEDIREHYLNTSVTTPIHFPEEVWEEIIMWIKRIELGERVSLVSLKFFRISYGFMHEEKQHILPTISIYNNGISEGWMRIIYEDGSIKEIPKSEFPMFEVTENITAGNNRIHIWGIDDRVLQFMPLLMLIYSDVSLFLSDICTIQNPNLIKLINLIRGKVRYISICRDVDFSEFKSLYEFLLDEIQMLYMSGMKNKDFELIKNWLYKPRVDGRLKSFITKSRSFGQEFIEIIKEDFVAAEKPIPFIIRFFTNIDQNFLFNTIINSVSKERLFIQDSFLYNSGIAWHIGRLPEDCPSSALELYNEMHTSMYNLPNVDICQIAIVSQKLHNGTGKDVLNIQKQEDLTNSVENVLDVNINQSVKNSEEKSNKRCCGCCSIL